MGYRGIIAIDANNKIAYIAITRSADRAAWGALTVE
jgi:hypothetical protein